MSLETEFAQHVDVALAPTPEMEILPDDNDRRIEQVDQHATHEVPRIFTGLGFVEVDDNGRIESGGREQFELLVEIGQQLRRRFRTHDRGRVTIERHHSRTGSGGRRELTNRLDDRLMSAMYAVVGANAQHSSLSLPRWRVEVRDELHEVGRYPRCCLGTKSLTQPRRTVWQRNRTPRTQPAANRARRRQPRVRRQRIDPAHGHAEPCRPRPRPPRRADSRAAPRPERSTRTGRVAGLRSSVKLPTAVRRRLVRWAPPPSRRPRSSASERMYVPAEQRTSIRSTDGSAVPATSNEYTVTGRGSRSTSIPSRANSCNRLPSTCNAETIGGICMIAPVRCWAAAARAMSTVTDDMSNVPVTCATGVEGRRRRTQHDVGGVCLSERCQEPQ